MAFTSSTASDEGSTFAAPSRGRGFLQAADGAGWSSFRGKVLHVQGWKPFQRCDNYRHVRELVQGKEPVVIAEAADDIKRFGTEE